MLAAQPFQMRSNPRFETYLDADLESGCVRGRGTVLTVSEAGLFVATDLRLSAGTRVTVAFDLPDFSPVRAAGVVLYQANHHERSGLGIKFLVADQAAEGFDVIRRWNQVFSIPS